VLYASKEVESMRVLIASLFLVLLMNAPATAAGFAGPPGLCRVLGQYLDAQDPSNAGSPLLERFESWVADHCVHLNELQVLGSHNSYHIQPAPGLDALLRLFSPETAFLADTFEYTHLPLDEQFELQGIRQIELDVFVDAPEGGLYAAPLGPVIVESFGLPPGPDFDPQGVMQEPGLKVLHVQEIDFRSTCLTFVRCLQVIQTWSAEHPGHLPITVLIEAMDDPIEDPGFGFVIPPEFDAAALDAVDAEIRSVFPAEQLLTPDDVRGNRSTLEKAVLKDGWPSLAGARGRVLFALDNTDVKKARYVEGHPSLRGRVMFTSSPPGEPEAAFVKVNDPIGNLERIQELVAQGFIVRTRADADTFDARPPIDTTRRDAALESGAQFVSTDYPDLDSNPFGTDYFVEIPDGMPGRCNPISAPPGCRSSALEVAD
jgi:hypothetical protein